MVRQKSDKVADKPLQFEVHFLVLVGTQTANVSPCLKLSNYIKYASLSVYMAAQAHTYSTVAKAGVQ